MKYLGMFLGLCATIALLLAYIYIFDLLTKPDCPPTTRAMIEWTLFGDWICAVPMGEK